MSIYQVVPSSTLNTTAEQLIAKNGYTPVGKETFCNVFLSDFANKAFTYDSFDGKLANDIVGFLRLQSEGWTILFDKAAGSDVTQAQMQSMQDYANQGYFAVVGLQMAGHGHVAAVVTGSALVPSGDWTRAGLPPNLPHIAQAGKDVFPDKGLSYGITSDDYTSGQLVLAVRLPPSA